MRGPNEMDGEMWSYIPLEARVPADHPLRPIRRMVDEVLERLSPRLGKLYSKVGRPSIAPERLLRALLLPMLYTIRSERVLMEQLDYNLLFRWFVGLRSDEPVWDPTVFSKNRDRFLRGDIARAFFQEVMGMAREQGLLSDEHFTVDGTLIEAWAGHKSFRPRDPDSGKGSSGGGRDFRGEKRSNATHQSTTDPEARLFRKGYGREAKLCYMGHVLMDNRHGLVVDARLTEAYSGAERDVAEQMAGAARKRLGRRLTLGGDKGYDTRAFVAGLRAQGVTPHVAQHNSARFTSAIDGRTTRHAGYPLSQQKRKLVEQVFGWMKTVGGMRKTRHRGLLRVGWMFLFCLAAYDLVRIRNVIVTAGQ